MNNKKEKMNIDDSVSFKLKEKRVGDGYIINGIILNFSDAEVRDLEYIAVKSINTALENEKFNLECYFGKKDMAEEYFEILESLLRASNRYTLNKGPINYSQKKFYFKNGSSIKIS